jgi:TolB-like protein
LPCFTKSFLTLFTAACLFPFILSCSSFSSQQAIDSVSPAWLPKDGLTPSVAIMPFDNLTSDEEMGTLVRKSFYNHFSSKNYRDIELSTVDRALESIQKTQAGTWREVPPETLGKYLHTDYVIYGKVKDYQKLFLGVYSQIALTVEVEMVDCRNGKGVWWKTETKRSHDGGIPLEWLSLMSAAARSGLHMQQERTLDLVEKTSRDLVAEIPEPSASPGGPLSVDIQIASFLEKSRATSTVEECKRIGLEPRVETVQLTDRTWYRVVLGPYKEIPAAERDKKLIAERTKFQPIFVHHSPGSQEASPR